MVARKKRSKKLSERSSTKPPDRYTFFVERNLGRYDVPEALRATGADIVVHHDILPEDSPDEDWIRLCGEKGYIAITEDKHIRYRQHELEAIIEYQARVIVLRAKLLTGKQKGEVIAAVLTKIGKFADENSPPFVGRLLRSGQVTRYEMPRMRRQT
jgi:hypothetical protein